MSEALSPASVQTLPTLDLDDLAEMIRQVVREEVSDILEARGFPPAPTIIEPGSPLHEDLVELRKLYESGELELLSYEKVFGESHDVSA